MANNSLADLNNHLFAALERVNEEELTQEELTARVAQAKSVCGVSQQIIANASVVLEAQRLVADGDLKPQHLPRLLQVEGK